MTRPSSPHVATVSPAVVTPVNPLTNTAPLNDTSHDIVESESDAHAKIAEQRTKTPNNTVPEPPTDTTNSPQEPDTGKLHTAMKPPYSYKYYDNSDKKFWQWSLSPYLLITQ